MSAISRLLPRLTPIFLVCIVAGCVASPGGGDDAAGNSSASAAAPISDPPRDIDPIVNRETNVAVFGSQRYIPSVALAGNIDSAYQQSLNDCMAREGIEGLLDWHPTDPDLSRETAVGVWLSEDAERFAFTNPITVLDQLVNGVVNSTLSGEESAAAQEDYDALAERLEADRTNAGTESYQAAERKCMSSGEGAEWKNRRDSLPRFSGPWSEEFAAAQVAAYKDDRMVEIKRDFGECISKAGLSLEASDSTTRDTFFTVNGEQFGVINEQQIKMASDVVRCKDETGAVEKLLNVVAEYEAPVYLEYERELQSLAVELDELERVTSEYWTGRD